MFIDINLLVFFWINSVRLKFILNITSINISSKESFLKEMKKGKK